tara:strand:+ start:14167 stop:15147 length:981 start_codon:yes stop_codon:yes gene_type:complete
MDILIVLEHNQNQLNRMSWEAVTAGQNLAKDLGLSVSILVMGNEIKSLANEAASSDVSEVLTAEHPLLKSYSADGYAQALTQIIENENPKYVIMGHTYMVRDFMPKVSALLKKPLLADNISYRIDSGNLILTKQVFSGKLVGDVIPAGDEPIIFTFQSAAFQSDDVQKGNGAEIRSVEISLDDSMIKSTSEEPFQETATAVDLSSADLIVAVGRGIGKEENLDLIKKLAEVLGAEIASSRPIVDSGWLPPYHQVGSSGQTVAPKMYLALGISGAIQHVVGMKGSKNVVVINKDPDAPLFELADYGVVGDILEIIPKLSEAVTQAKS